MSDDPKPPACDHKFVYAGVRYAAGANPLPGSGARRLYYGHVYFCERCLEKRGEAIQGPEDSTYDKPRFDATPGTFDEVGVPSYDRRYGYR